MRALASWIGERTPPAPAAFLRWLRTPEDDSELGSEVLCRLAVRDMQVALSRPGRNREGGFYLLAADAFATYACEAATEEDDIDGALRTVLERIQLRDS